MSVKILYTQTDTHGNVYEKYFRKIVDLEMDSFIETVRIHIVCQMKEYHRRQTRQENMISKFSTHIAIILPFLLAVLHVCVCA